VFFLAIGVGADTRGEIPAGFRPLFFLLGCLDAVAAYMLITKKRRAVKVARIASLLPPSIMFSWYFFISRRVKYTYPSKTGLQLAKEALAAKLAR
jgi:hypothetical protein